jgi:small subunit ribosomal protein S18
MAKSRSKNKDNARRAKKKTSVLTTDGIEYVDWKDVNLLRRFMSERSKVRARRVTGNDAQQQNEVARAIKNAREMALLPYVTRITQQRGRDKGASARGSAAPARPTAPPPQQAPPAANGEEEAAAELYESAAAVEPSATEA